MNTSLQLNILNIKKQIALFFTLVVLFVAKVVAQTPAPIACNVNNCTNANSSALSTSATVTTFQNCVPKATNQSANGLAVGSVWQFSNIATQGVTTINAEIKIVNIENAILHSIDDDNDAAGNGVTADLFAPRISPDVNCDESIGARRGWVEFEITFFTNNFSTPTTLENINFVHYDIDGGGSTTSWFREMGYILKPTAGNPTIQAYTGTELVGHSFTEYNRLWDGFVGSIGERSGVSNCAEVAVQANFNTPQSKITFRMGYDFKAIAGSGFNYGCPIRQYGAKFGGFNFPSIQSLPVKFDNFSVAKANNNTVAINWETVTEHNNVSFEVQKSTTSGVDFTTVATVATKAVNGNSANLLTYNVTDIAKQGTVYYRIMQQDKDGKKSYSDIKSIKSIEKTVSMLVYPTPSTNGTINIKIANETKNTKLIINNAIGAAVQQITIVNNNIQINNLKAGFYTAAIINNNNEVITAQKIIVQ
jgi:uncharacterized protein (DUF2141 family)